MTSTMRIVAKEHYNEQYFFEVPNASLLTLEPSSVRIKPRLLGLQGSSNLAYCMAGRMLHWWDAWPVPSHILSKLPNNDGDAYGIAPCWGFAEIFSSNIPDLKPGQTLWGFMPTHSCPVDLQLARSEEIADHWIEESPHRAKLMALYNRYVVIADALTSSNFVKSAWAASLRSVWECGYVLNRFNFPHDSEDPLIHPMPELGLPWSREQGDLKSAVVVCLGAGGKTSKSFVQQLATNRSAGSGPLGLLEVSSTTESVVPKLQSAFEHRAVEYGNALSPDILDWITGLQARKVVIIDMGSRDNIDEKISDWLRQELLDMHIDMVRIGREMKVYNSDGFAALMAERSRQNVVPMNTSGVRTEAIKALGEAKYFEQMVGEFRRVLNSELARHSGGSGEGKVLGTKLKIGEGVRGPLGLEKAWTDICNGDSGGHEGLAFRV